jgi:hypothetical protein
MATPLCVQPTPPAAIDPLRDASFWDRAILDHYVSLWSMRLGSCPLCLGNNHYRCKRGACAVWGALRDTFAGSTYILRCPGRYDDAMVLYIQRQVAEYYTCAWGRGAAVDNTMTPMAMELWHSIKNTLVGQSHALHAMKGLVSGGMREAFTAAWDACEALVRRLVAILPRIRENNPGSRGCPKSVRILTCDAPRRTTLLRLWNGDVEVAHRPPLLDRATALRRIRGQPIATVYRLIGAVELLRLAVVFRAPSPPPRVRCVAGGGGALRPPAAVPAAADESESDSDDDLRHPVVLASRNWADARV